MNLEHPHINDLRCGHVLVTTPVCGTYRETGISPLDDMSNHRIPEMRAIHKTVHRISKRDHADAWILLTLQAIHVSIYMNQGFPFELALEMERNSN